MKKKNDQCNQRPIISCAGPYMGLNATKPVFRVSVNLRGTQISLLIYRDQLEHWKFACSKFRYDTFPKVNNKVAVQSARMRSLVCAFAVHKQQSFSHVEAYIYIGT